MISTKLVVSKLVLLISTFFALMNYQLIVFANGADRFDVKGKRLEFEGLDSLISTAILTLQYLAGGIAIFYLVLNGIKIMTSSDSHHAMEEAKSGIFKVIAGCFVVFLAATIFGIIFTAVKK